MEEPEKIEATQTSTVEKENRTLGVKSVDSQEDAAASHVGYSETVPGSGNRVVALPARVASDSQEEVATNVVGRSETGQENGAVDLPSIADDIDKPLVMEKRITNVKLENEDQDAHVLAKPAQVETQLIGQKDEEARDPLSINDKPLNFRMSSIEFIMHKGCIIIIFECSSYECSDRRVKEIKQIIIQINFNIYDANGRINNYEYWKNIIRLPSSFNVPVQIESTVYPVLFTGEDVPFNENQNAIDQTGRLSEQGNFLHYIDSVPYPDSGADMCPLPPLEEAATYQRAGDNNDVETDDVGGTTPVPETNEGEGNQNLQTARIDIGNVSRAACLRCQQSMRNVVFLPCRHLLYCRPCARDIRVCVVCESSIVQKVYIQY